MTLPKSLRDKRGALLTKGPCLIPIVGAESVLTCHENDYCDCEMKKAYDQGVADHAELVKGLVEALDKFMSSAVILNAPFASYSEAFANVREALIIYREEMGNSND